MSQFKLTRLLITFIIIQMNTFQQFAHNAMLLMKLLHTLVAAELIGEIF